MRDTNKQTRSDIFWIGVALLAAVACGVAASLEETTMMRILFLIGAAVALIFGGFNLMELLTARREQREKEQRAEKELQDRESQK